MTPKPHETLPAKLGSFCRRRAGRLVAAVFAAAAAAVAWLCFSPGSPWLYYTDGIAIRQLSSDATPRYVLWERPAPLPGAFNTAADVYEPCISADGSLMVFTRGRARNNADLFACRWDGQSWGAAEPLKDVNTAADELGPALSPDGKHLYFYSDRPGGAGGYDIWVALWDGYAWTAPAALGEPVNSVFNEYGPALSPGGDRLYFSSNRPRRDLSDEERRAWQATLRELLHHGDYDIFAAELLWAPAEESAPLPPLPRVEKAERVKELNSPADEGEVAVTPRGDFLYFASNREGGLGGFDIYRARMLHGAILPPENLGRPANSRFNEMDPALRLEGFGLVFSSNREEADPLNYRLYATTSRDVILRRDFGAARLLLLSLARVKWWLAALPLAIAALMYLLRHLLHPELRRQHSLLHRCLLLSALVHMMVLALMAFWIISAEMIRTMGEPAMAVDLDLDALARERIALDIREEVTQLPETPDALIVEQAERRLPIPEIERAESPADPLVSADVALLAFAEPVAVERERPLEEMPASRADEVRLEELEIAPSALRMEERQAPAPAAAPEEPRAVPPPSSASAPEHSAPAPPRPRERTPELAATTVAAEPARPPAAPAPEAVPPAEALEAGLPVVVPAVAAAMPVLEMDGAPERERGMPERVLAMAAPGAAARAEKALPAPAAPETTRVRPDAEPARETPVSAVPMPEEIREADTAGAPRLASPAVAQTPERRSVSLPAMEAAPRGQAVTNGAEIVLAMKARAERPAAEAVPAQGGPRADRPRPRAEAGSLPARTAVEAAPAPEAAAPEPALAAAQAAAASAPPAAAQAALRMERRPTPRRSGAPARAAAIEDVVRAAPGSGLVVAAPGPSAPNPRPAVRGGEKPLPGAVIVAAAERPAPLPRLNGVGNIATRQLPAMDVGTELKMETRELTSVVHYALRRPEARGRIIVALGGSEESEATVRRALDWFTRTQEADGHWDIAKHGGEGGHDVAATAMAMLCYFGWGAKHTEDGPYRQQMQRAVDWLVAQQKENGDLRSKDMYDHGLATMALTEAYGITRDERLREPALKAVKFIGDAQHKDTGGWRYQPGDPGDTSVFGWQVMALKSAEMAGLDVAAEALKLSGKWMDAVGGGSQGGLYGYQNKSATPAMTAESMFCRQLTGWGPEEPRMRETAEYLNTRLPGDPDFYYWYYGTLCLFQHQGPIWDTWNVRLKQRLMTSQVAGGEQAGSWEPQGPNGNRMGRVVTTAMATLSLEVYYRYLPLYGLRK